jgi:hypothetical protein
MKNSQNIPEEARNKTIDRMTPRIIGSERETGKTIWGFNVSSDLRVQNTPT